MTHSHPRWVPSAVRPIRHYTLAPLARMGAGASSGFSGALVGFLYVRADLAEGSFVFGRRSLHPSGYNTLINEEIKKAT